MFKSISIHALVKRATDKTKYYYFLRINFNPRPREEGDLFQDDLFSYKLISIHALVKRATLALKDTSKKYVYFNPRPREEGDRA